MQHRWTVRVFLFLGMGSALLAAQSAGVFPAGQDLHLTAPTSMAGNHPGMPATSDPRAAGLERR